MDLTYRINPLTNRKVKIGTRTYIKLLSKGYVDNGATFVFPKKIFKIENLDRHVEENSKDYNHLISFGYTPISIDGQNILEAPRQNVLVEKFDKLNEFYPKYMEMFGNKELYDYFMTLPFVTINDMEIKHLSYDEYITFLKKLISGDLYEADDENDGNDGNEAYFIITVKWSNFIPSPHGALYDGEKNCAIKAIEQHLIDQNKPHPELIEKLYEQFKNGVYHFDFEVLACKIKAKIIVKTPFSVNEYGTNNMYKQLKLYVNNNHALIDKMTKSEIFNREVKFVDNILDVLHTVKNEIVDYIHGCALFTPTTIYKNKFIKTDQGHTYDLENSPFDFYSETGYHLNNFLIDNPELINISSGHRNINAIKSISKHGIHYYTKNDQKVQVPDLLTFDLKQAYTNFHKWPIYEGIPTDLDNCISDKAFYVSLVSPENNSILDNAGFGLIEYFDLYNNQSIERWVSFPYIKMLIRQHRLYKFKYGLISRNKTNLNLNFFKNAPKRALHKVLGRINIKSTQDTFITLDPLIAYAKCKSEWTQLESPPKSGNKINIYTGYKKSETPSKKYYPHVASYIQFYTEIMVEELAFKSIKNGENIISVLVDEITITNNKNKLLKQCDEELVDVNFWHTNKISKAISIDKPINYHKAEMPIKFSNKFNSILQNKGNRVKITGSGGTGKSYISNQLEDQIDLELLAPTNEACQQFIQNGKKCSTVCKRLIEHTRAYNILIDECSLVTQQTNKEIEGLSPDLLIYVGDDKQLLPIKGDPINDSEYSIIELTQNYRQLTDPEFARKLNILRLNLETDEKFGTIISESKAVQLCKLGGTIACSINMRVNYFNGLCNGGNEFKEGSRVRFIKNKRSQGYYNGLLGVIIKIDNELFIKTITGDFHLKKYINVIELSYAMTVHKLQGKTLKTDLIYDDTKKSTFKNIKYTAFSRVCEERLLYILK